MNKIIFIFWGTVLLLLTLFSYLFIDPNFHYLQMVFTGFAFTSRGVATGIYITVITTLFIMYLYILKLYEQNRFSNKAIQKLILLTFCLLFFSYPTMLSYDIFNYIATAKVTFFYQENPYIVMPIEFTGDELLAFTHAANKVALYGPGWIILTGFPYSIGASKFLLTLFSFKLFIALFYFGTLWMLYKLSRSWYPVLLFGLNPLVIVETLISSHNDVVMIFFALSSIYALQKKKLFLAGMLLTASILIKYATIFLMPIVFYIAWNQHKDKQLDWQKIYLYCAIAMGAIFMLSPLREEMYPWYASWFLVFIALLINKRYIHYLAIAFSFGLMLRYTPYMLLGDHSGITPLLRIVCMLLPVSLVACWYIIKKKLWRKNIFH